MPPRAPRGVAFCLSARPLVADAPWRRATKGAIPLMSVTSQLCEKITATGYADFDAPVTAAARRLVLDGIAIAVAGSKEDAIQILAAHFKEQGGAPQATAI